MTTITAHLHGCIVAKDGTKSAFWTRQVPVKIEPVRSKRITTASPYMVLLNGRWRRVHAETVGRGIAHNFLAAKEGELLTLTGIPS